MFPSDGWSWYGPEARITGQAWGGSLEIVDFHLRTNRYLIADDAYDGCILFLETSEEMWPASYVYRVLMSMGERGRLPPFAAVRWARPKGWSREQPNGPHAKVRFVEAQRDALLAALAEYNPASRSSLALISDTPTRSTSSRAAERSPLIQRNDGSRWPISRSLARDGHAT